jgi:hypothetical protein
MASAIPPDQVLFTDDLSQTGGYIFGTSAVGNMIE